MQPELPSAKPPKDAPVSGPSAPGIRRWFGSGAFIALGVFVIGRLALEPLRSVSQVDNEGLEPYGAVETFRLRENPIPVEVAFLGSSQTIWGIVTQAAAKKLGRKPTRVANLGTAGGTPFEMWSLVRRNPREFDHLRLAVIEINPFILRPGLEGDPRVFAAVSSRASFLERLMLRDRAVRILQIAEWLLPLNSVRRSLESALHTIMGNRTWQKLDPDLYGRVNPGRDWSSEARIKKDRHLISPESAAKRMVGNWQLSSFQDYALRSLLQWMRAHRIPVVLHQLPIHPEVADLVLQDPRYAKSYLDYCDYVDSLEPAPAAIFRMLSPVEIGGDAGSMADRTHLNEAGALLYSTDIGQKARPYVRRAHTSQETEAPESAHP